jgi:hypothetical protein
VFFARQEDTMKQLILNGINSRLHEVRSWLGSPCWAVQKIWFSIFVIQAIVQFVLEIAAGGNIGNAVSAVLAALKWWVIIAGVTAVLCMVANKLWNLDLWIYYNIWIEKLAPSICRYQPPSARQRILDINRSRDFSPNKKTPTFVKREHLMRRRFWPYWTFSIVTILDPRKIKQQTIVRNGDTTWLLDVDLRNESFGIYSTEGKRFLESRYAEAVRTEQMQNLSSGFHEFMLPLTPPGSSMTWGEVGAVIPLRWASGGFLPIVYHKGRHWALLFLRDIFPVGLNVANGASEGKDEYKNVHRLIGREFSEETILLSACPRPGGAVSWTTFGAFSFAPGIGLPMASFINKDFAMKQARLRYEHDGIELVPSPKAERRISPIQTPFVVRTTYHTPDLKASETKEIRNVVYSLNPAEFGIEIIWLCTFNLYEGEYLIDGEYHLGREVLIRRPVILVDMEFLRQVYDQHQTLGDLSSKDETFGGKVLPLIPKEHSIVFDVDVELRHHRLCEIEEQLGSRGLPKARRRILVWEQDRIRSWLSEYEETVKLARDKGLRHEHLRTLCPVTWKTLEMVFAHSIDYTCRVAGIVNRVNVAAGR